MRGRGGRRSRRSCGSCRRQLVLARQVLLSPRQHDYALAASTLERVRNTYPHSAVADDAAITWPSPTTDWATMPAPSRRSTASWPRPAMRALQQLRVVLLSLSFRLRARACRRPRRSRGLPKAADLWIRWPNFGPGGAPPGSPRRRRHALAVQPDSRYFAAQVARFGATP